MEKKKALTDGKTISLHGERFCLTLEQEESNSTAKFHIDAARG